MSYLLLSILFLSAGAQTQGEELFLKGQYAEAAAALEKLPNAEKTAESLNRLAMSYHFLNRFKEAETAYRQALRVDSESALVHNNLGALFYSQRKFNDADSAFRRAADHNADNTVLHANLRAARYARDNVRLALARANELASQSPLLLEPLRGDFLAVVSVLPAKTMEDAVRHELRGDSYMARKLYDDAIIEYKKSLSFDRYNALGANRLGIAYHHLRKYREAEQQYREALRYRPNYLDAMINLGVLDYVRQDFEGALSRYTRALKLAPNSVTLLGNLGACLFSMERWEEGVRVYQQALALDPGLFDQRGAGAGPSIQMSVKGNSMMNLHFAKIFAARGDKELAISYLYKAIENGLDDVKLLRDEQAFEQLAADERFVRMLETIATGKSRI
jgi:Flp pilus assembly protein TadD